MPFLVFSKKVHESFKCFFLFEHDVFANCCPLLCRTEQTARNKTKSKTLFAFRGQVKKDLHRMNKRLIVPKTKNFCQVGGGCFLLASLRCGKFPMEFFWERSAAEKAARKQFQGQSCVCAHACLRTCLCI